MLVQLNGWVCGNIIVVIYIYNQYITKQLIGGAITFGVSQHYQRKMVKQQSKWTSDMHGIGSFRKEFWWYNHILNVEHVINSY